MWERKWRWVSLMRFMIGLWYSDFTVVFYLVTSIHDNNVFECLTVFSDWKVAGSVVYGSHMPKTSHVFDIVHRSGDPNICGLKHVNLEWIECLVATVFHCQAWLTQSELRGGAMHVIKGETNDLWMSRLDLEQAFVFSSSCCEGPWRM